ncbi:MAG: DUF2061 domain-containing protein [Hylemonella sp.]|nr:DUF2061 domain-containing protein [Hylemonella sp.]MDP1938367.1 DUF2061 domain-containing protein [Hylemonella sp.]
MANFARANLATLKKTASYYVVHITVAAFVAYAVTGDLLMSFTLSLLEPTVQAVAFFCHEKVWERWGNTHAASRAKAASALT